MKQLIITTFLIIIVFSVINLVANFFLYIGSKKKSIYLQLVLFWAALIVNFLLQSVAQTNENIIILLYGYAVFPLNILAFITLKFINKKYPIKLFIAYTILCFLSTFALFQFSLSFILRALPMAFATGAPLIYSFYIITVKNWKRTDPLMKVHSLVMFLQGVHCLNFALFRMDDNAQLWGWPVSYALYQLMATTLPAITLSFFHIQEKDRLKDLVAQRTDKIKKAMEQKEHVFKVLSHDISNPLSILKLNLGLHAKDLKTDKDLIAVATKTADRITNIIEQTRILNQVDLDLDEVPVKKVFLNESLRTVADYFKESCKSKNLSIELNLTTSNKACLMADKHSFENSIISNFLSNAIKFSPIDGKVEVITKSDPENTYIEIRDCGVGIPEDLLSIIFDYNTNISRKGTCNESGNGLGMSIAKKYIDFFKGEVQIESRVQSEQSPGFTLIKLKFPQVS